MTGAAHSLLRNSVSLIVGRLGLSALRLGAAIAIARLAGGDRFGEYVVLMSVVAIFEWLVDAGQTDIAVRQMCADPGDSGAVLAGLARLKRWSALLLAPTMPLALVLLGYGAPLVTAAAVGGIGVAAYALLQVDRAALRVAMRPDLDIGAELIAVVIMLPLTAWIALRHGSAAALLGAYSVSRLLHAALLHLAVARRGLVERRGPTVPASGLLRAALPLGAAGLLVASYDGLAPIMLSKLASLHDVAEYGAANRFAMPVLTIVQAISGAFFPVLARLRDHPVRLGETQDAALGLSLLVAATLAAGLFCAAPVLLHLTGLATAASIVTLRLMCGLVVARAVSSAMAPLIVIGDRQARGLALTLASLVAQAAAIPLLVPAFGIRGVVIGYLVIEFVLGIVPISYLGLSATGARIDWMTPARFVGAAAASAAIVTAALGSGWRAGIAAATLTLVLAGVGGADHRRRLVAAFGVMRQRSAGLPA